MMKAEGVGSMPRKAGATMLHTCLPTTVNVHALDVVSLSYALHIYSTIL